MIANPSDAEVYQLVLVKSEENDIESKYWQSLEMPYSMHEARKDNAVITKDDFWYREIRTEKEREEYLEYKNKVIEEEKMNK